MALDEEAVVAGFVVVGVQGCDFDFEEDLGGRGLWDGMRGC